MNMFDPPEVTIRYRSSRSEVWRHYWHVWRKRLWLYWLAAVIIMESIAVFGGGRPITMQRLMLGLCIVALAWGFFALYPLLKFKPQERVLTADPNGIRTKIGKTKGTRSWTEVESIEDRDDVICILIAPTMNAFLIPTRAFKTSDERFRFLTYCRKWHGEGNSHDVLSRPRA